MSDERYVEVGRVVSPHGLRGWCVCRTYNEESETLRTGLDVLLVNHQKKEEKFLIEKVQRKGKGVFLIKFQGVDSREQSEALKGAKLLVCEGALSPLAEDEYYWIHLIGCKVLDEEIGSIGEVAEIISTGAHDVLVVNEPGGQEILVPFVDEYVKDVNVKRKEITVRNLDRLK